MQIGRFELSMSPLITRWHIPLRRVVKPFTLLYSVMGALNDFGIIDRTHGSFHIAKRFHKPFNYAIRALVKCNLQPMIVEKASKRRVTSSILNVKKLAVQVVFKIVNFIFATKSKIKHGYYLICQKYPYDTYKLHSLI